jgi:site-specific recombinase XerD
MSLAWENTSDETQQSSADSIINSKIKSAVAGLQPSIQKYFLEFPTQKDKEAVADFLNVCTRQENAAIKTKRAYLVALTYLLRYLDGKKSFSEVTAKDLSDYLTSLYRPASEDPDQSWINTQLMFGLCLGKFFKWLAYPELTPQERKRLPSEMQPAVLKGLVLQRKREILQKARKRKKMKSLLIFSYRRFPKLFQRL